MGANKWKYAQEAFKQALKGFSMGWVYMGSLTAIKGLIDRLKGSDACAPCGPRRGSTGCLMKSLFSASRV